MICKHVSTYRNILHVVNRVAFKMGRHKFSWLELCCLKTMSTGTIMTNQKTSNKHFQSITASRIWDSDRIYCLQCWVVSWTNSTCPKTQKNTCFFLKRQHQGYRPQATRFNDSSVHGLQGPISQWGRAAGPCSIQSLVSLRRHTTSQTTVFCHKKNRKLGG